MQNIESGEHILKLIAYYSRRILAAGGDNLGQPWLGRIDALTRELLAIADGMAERERRALLAHLQDADLFFLNISLFGAVEGIAFCHNFPPVVNTSAYVASRRLQQIDAIYGQTVKWHVFRANMHTRPNDERYYALYGSRRCASVETVGAEAYRDEQCQWQWGQKAFAAVAQLDAPVIYSRSMWIGSHMAALLYKQAHPGTFWFAEFSDLHAITTDNRLRQCNYPALGPFRGNFYFDFEREIMEKADYLIFTCKRQKEHMICHNPLLNDRRAIMAKSHALIHPPVDRRLLRLSFYLPPVADNVINIACFGNSGSENNFAPLYELLRKFEHVHIYAFLDRNRAMSHPPDIARKLTIADEINELDFLHGAGAFDFLYLEDIAFGDAVNPFLPSRFVEYLATGARILARLEAGSSLSAFSCARMTRLEDFGSVYEARFGAPRQ